MITVENIKQAYAKNNNLEFVYFCSHKPQDPGAIGKECLSQWYPSPIRDYYNLSSEEQKAVSEAEKNR